MKRRYFFLGLLGIGAGTVATFELMPKRRKALVIDPQERSYVYENGWIVKV